MEYVIIGNSAAAVGAVEGIRSNDRKGKITIVSKEKHHTYSRPLISYLLEGKTDRQRMKYRPDDFYKTNGCTCFFGKCAVAVDADAKTVTLDSGEIVPFDKLLYAAGSLPFVPNFNGIEKVKKKFTFMSLDDALALKKALTPQSRVLIIGAGLIGIKCAEGIKDLCAEITIADLSDRVLSSVLDKDASEKVKALIEENGIRFRLGTSVAQFGKNSALLTNGEKVDFDVLVLAVGVKPNTEILKTAGAKAERGLVTDCCCKTSLPDIFAAGDCTESFDISSGKSRVLALLPNAYRQGECAGINMAGGEKRFECAAPMNALCLFGMHIITAGTYEGKAYSSVSDECCKKLFYDGNCLKGFIMIGDVRNAGIYTHMITDKTPLSDIDFGLICEKPTLMAFQRTNGGAKNGY